jgi:hypothetical protein
VRPQTPLAAVSVPVWFEPCSVTSPVVTIHPCAPLRGRECSEVF